MRRCLLPVGLVLGCVWGVTAVAACGGNVVVDDAKSGTGGVGGATSNVSSSVVSSSVVSSSDVSTASVGPGSSTGTGPSCGCSQFCAQVATCGAPPGTCQACSQFSQTELDCVCQVSTCAAIQQCFTVPSSSSTGTGTGGDATTCTQCTDDAENVPCQAQLIACKNNPQCLALWNCDISCDYTAGCKQMCTQAIPGGATDYAALVACSVCTSCPMQCAGQPIFNDYCVPTGG